MELKWGNHTERSELVITSEWEVDIKHKDECSNSRFLEGEFIKCHIHNLFVKGKLGSGSMKCVHIIQSHFLISNFNCKHDLEVGN